MNENGGSIPTDSEEWTLHLLYFYLDVLITTNRSNNHQINIERKSKILLNAEKRNEAVCWIK